MGFHTRPRSKLSFSLSLRNFISSSLTYRQFIYYNGFQIALTCYISNGNYLKQSTDYLRKMPSTQARLYPLPNANDSLRCISCHNASSYYFRGESEAGLEIRLLILAQQSLIRTKKSWRGGEVA